MIIVDEYLAVRVVGGRRPDLRGHRIATIHLG
jgi:hypothetical protein